MKNPVRELLDRATMIRQETQRRWEGVDLGKFDPKEALGYKFKDGEVVRDAVTGKRGKVITGVREVIQYRRSRETGG